MDIIINMLNKIDAKYEIDSENDVIRLRSADRESYFMSNIVGTSFWFEKDGSLKALLVEE